MKPFPLVPLLLAALLGSAAALHADEADQPAPLRHPRTVRHPRRAVDPQPAAEPSPAKPKASAAPRNFRPPLDAVVVSFGPGAPSVSEPARRNWPTEGPSPAVLADLAKQEGRYPWRTAIVTTIFWVGEPPAKNNPVSNVASAWDSDWQGSFGGFDDPEPAGRDRLLPRGFVPKQNPFYIALPYNDVKDRHVTKPEAAAVVPWYKALFRRPGVSVCRNRWVAVRKGNRVCYAQWSDCGPFRTDHWQYVFGTERPRPNLNHGAGLDVSPAVRDFLRLNDGHDLTDWRFVELDEVPDGPWTRYGSNNQFVRQGFPVRRLASNDLIR